MEFLGVAYLWILGDPEKSQPRLCKIYEFPQGPANPEVKLGSEKFAEACSERMTYCRVFRNSYLGRYDCIGLDLSDPGKP